MLKLTPTCALFALELALPPRYYSESRPGIATRELRAAVRRKSQCWLSWKAFGRGPVPPPHVCSSTCRLSLPAPGLNPQRVGADPSRACLLHDPGGCTLREIGTHAFQSETIMAMAYFCPSERWACDICTLAPKHRRCTEAQLAGSGPAVSQDRLVVTISYVPHRHYRSDGLWPRSHRP